MTNPSDAQAQLPHDQHAQVSSQQDREIAISPPQVSRHHIKKTRWKWTGFSEKTLWDWLQLLAILAVPLAVSFATTYFAYQQAQLSDIQ